MRKFIVSAASAAFFVVAAPVSAQMPQPLPPEALVDAADPAKADWLRGHVVVDGPVTGGLRIDLPDSVYRAKLILLGESHGVAAPQVLDLELLTQLNRRIGLRDYLAEVDPVQAARLNHYLETGDEASLTAVFDFWSAGPHQWGNAAFEAKVRAIRALNQTLPADRRIRFLGVDAPQDWAGVAAWLGERGVAVDAEALKAAKTGPARAGVILPALGKVEPLSDLGRLEATLKAVSGGLNREAVIFESYQRAVRSGDLGDRPAYGLWGAFHVFQGGISGAKPFAAMVRASDLPAAASTVSILMLSLDSAVQIPAPMPQGLTRLRLTEFNIDGPFVMVKGAATLRAASQPKRITVFDVGAAGNPFAQADFVAVRTSLGQNLIPDDPARPTRDYIQFIGVVRDSDWAAPRGEAAKP